MIKTLLLTTCLTCLALPAVSQDHVRTTWLPLREFFGVEQAEPPATTKPEATEKKAPYGTTLSPSTASTSASTSAIEDFLRQAPEDSATPAFPARQQATTSRILPASSVAAPLETMLAQQNWFMAANEAARLLQMPLTAQESTYVHYGLSIAQAQQNQIEAAWQSLQPALEQNAYFGRDIQLWALTLLLHQAEIALLNNQTAVARQWLDQSAQYVGNMNTRLRIKRLVKQMNTTVTTEPRYVRVGAMLPLSGPYAKLGEALLKTIQIAVFETSSVHLVVYPVDTGATASSAVNAAQTLQDLNVEAVIGPLLSSQVDAVAPMFSRQNIPLLPFSSDPHVAAENVHLLGFRADQQARAMAAHAAATSRTDVAALVPATPYGYEAFNTFQQRANELALNLREPVFFNPEKADLRAELDILLPKPAKELAVTSADGVSLTLPPTEPFSALFLPVSGQMLPLLSSQMAVYDVDRMDIMLLGTTDWAQLTGGDPYVPQAHFPAIAGHTFAAEYAALYQQQPPGLAVLAADALHVLAAAATEDMPLHNALLRPSGFAAPGGAVRFYPHGRTERAFALRAIRHSRLADIQPAPLLLPPLVPGQY